MVTRGGPTPRDAQRQRLVAVSAARNPRRQPGLRRNVFVVISHPRNNNETPFRTEIGELRFVSPALREAARNVPVGLIGRLVQRDLLRVLRRTMIVPRDTGRLRRTSTVRLRPSNGTILVTQQYYGYYVSEGTIRIRPRHYMQRVVNRVRRRNSAAVRRLIEEWN